MQRQLEYQRLGNGFWLAAQAWPLGFPLQAKFPIHYNIEEDEDKIVLHKTKPDFNAGWVFTHLNEQQGRDIFDPMFAQHYEKVDKMCHDLFPGRDFIIERGWVITDWDFNWFESEAPAHVQDEWGRFMYDLRQLRFDFNSEFLSEVYKGFYLQQ